MFLHQTTIVFFLLMLSFALPITGFQCLDTTTGTAVLVSDDTDKMCCMKVYYDAGTCSNIEINYMTRTTLKNLENKSRNKRDTGDVPQDLAVVEKSGSCTMASGENLALDGSFDQFKNLLEYCERMTDTCRNTIKAEAENGAFATGGLLDPTKIALLKSSNKFSMFGVLMVLVYFAI